MEFQGLTRNSREHKVSLWSGPEQLIFPDCSLVFRKSFDVDIPPTLLLRKRRLEGTNLAARMASRRTIRSYVAIAKSHHDSSFVSSPDKGKLKARRAGEWRRANRVFKVLELDFSGYA
jgi:hypothetical protein